MKALKNIVLAATVALTATALVAEEPDLFELRRELIDQIELAYTKGDIAALLRMAGKPVPETFAEKTKRVVEGAQSRLDRYEGFEVPNRRELWDARHDLLQLIQDTEDDSLVHEFYLAALTVKQRRERFEHDLTRLLKDMQQAQDELERHGTQLESSSGAKHRRD
jgi:hypothetical protein